MCHSRMTRRRKQRGGEIRKNEAALKKVTTTQKTEREMLLWERQGSLQQSKARQAEKKCFLSPETPMGLGSRALTALGLKIMAKYPIGLCLPDSLRSISGQFDVLWHSLLLLSFPLILEAFT